MHKLFLRKHVIFLIICCLFLLSGRENGICSQSAGQKQKMYTAYNIWVWPKHHMNCLNFKGGRSKIPVVMVQMIAEEGQSPN